MKSRSVVLAAVVAALLFSVGAGCGRRMQPPVIDSAVAIPDGSSPRGVTLVVRAHDPDSDSIRLRVEWGDNTETLTAFYCSPCSIELGHSYSASNVCPAVVYAFDMNNVSEPVITTVPIEPCGKVLWYWQDPEQGAMMTSALVANDGEDEVVMSYSWDDFRFYAVRVSSGQSKASAHTKFTEYDFDGHPALCAATGHVIVGSNEGELYALTLGSLARAWRWPDVSTETLEPFVRFGAPAIKGSDIYVGRDQDYDSLYRLYKFTDLGGSVTKAADYVLGTCQAVVDAPAIDADGSVYFGTDSGYLIKIDANLSSPVWRVAVERGSEVRNPALGGDGTIYCLTDSLGLSAFYAANGFPLWSRPFYGKPTRLAVGSSAILVGTSAGMVYSVRPQDGNLNWMRQIGRGGFETAPIVAANGYLYIQDDNDVLYCLKQDNGAVWWVCDCNSYLPGSGRGGSPRPRKTGLTDYDPNPSITSDGNILVVGRNALFCVAGYAHCPLDPDAPWPKWQRDLYNTGYISGGR
ncbi:PQQ-binding-like beta-propeller repeat protein [candidate division WOR-3 bacterium]|nr:PQQ-binding-like beta-propeller repeat protein [candidate division WOR-3 bacterium]